jgi:hypothetical protein
MNGGSTEPGGGGELTGASRSSRERERETERESVRYETESERRKNACAGSSYDQSCQVVWRD